MKNAMKNAARILSVAVGCRAGRFALVLAVLVHAAGSAIAGGPTANCDLEPGPERTVAAVLDGESVRLDDGKIVRLIGILAPRAFDAGAAPGHWPLETKARQGLAGLVAGRTVSLGFAGPRNDRYGRLRAHVHVGDGAARAWVQGALVGAGLARVQPEPGDAACAEALLAIETAASAGKRGLWAEATYRVRPAERPSELLRYRGTYQVVTGRVSRMRKAGGVSILDLENAEAVIAGRGWRPGGATRISWRRADVALSGDWTRTSIVGTSVVVRGWVVGRGGPEIRVVAPAQLGIADNGQGASAK